MFASDAYGNSIIFTEGSLRMFNQIFHQLFRRLYRVRNYFSCNHLCIWFLVGLLLGCCLSIFAADELSAIQIPQLLSSPSFLRLLFVNSVPVFVVFALIRFSLRGLLNPVAFFQAFSMSFTGMLVYFAVGESGWLIRPLLMFSSGMVSLLLLIYLCLRTAQPGRRDILIALMTVLGITVFDRFIISEFLENLIVYF
jgi:hypothetical protein